MERKSKINGPVVRLRGVVALVVSLGVGVPWVGAATDGVGVSGLNPLLQKKKEQGSKRRSTRGVDRRRGTAGRQTKPPKSTPPKARPSTGSRKSGRDRTPPPRRSGASNSSPRSATETVSSRLNIDADDLNKPPEERMYSFSIVDGSYKELVENFARMAGIGVVGEAPIGPVTLVSSEKMDFRSALTRVQRLLFMYKPLEPYTLLYEDNQFEVIRVTDIWRRIQLDHIFMNVAAFEASTIDDNELAMLLYSPPDTSVADFTLLRDFMPDYVRIAPMESANSLSIFALVRDIKKYLSLIKLFEGAGDDPRVLAKLPVEFLTPSAAVETLGKLMEDLGTASSGSKAPVRRPSRGSDANIDLPGQRTIMFPDDAQGVIIVRAVPKKIDDIKEMLTFVDVDFGEEDIDPVLIPIEYADVNDIIGLINPLLTPESPPAGRSKPVRRGRGKGKKAAPAPVKSEDVMLLANTRTNTLVVVAVDEELERVRRYVALFDVPVEEGRPVFVPLKYTDPSELGPLVTQIVTGQSTGKTKSGEAAFNVIAEPRSQSLILIGPREDVANAKEVIAVLDVDDGEDRLHSYQLINAVPSTVLDVIQMIDIQSGGALPPKGRPGRARRIGKAHLYTDDVLRILYVFCTDQEWEEKYLPLAKSLDEQAAKPTAHVSIPVKNLPASEVITTLKTLFSQGKKPGGARFAAAGDDVIVVSGATPKEIAQIRSIIADVDLGGPDRVRRLFSIEHADPMEIQSIIGTLVLGVSKTSQRRTKGPPSSTGGLLVSVIDRTVIVSGTEEDVSDVADLIASVDVPDSVEKETRVYSVGAGRDVENIVALLEALLAPDHPKPKVAKGGRVSATMDEVRVVAQPASRRIIVSAPLDRFDDVEAKLDVLLAGDPPETSLVRFIEVKHVGADEVAALIEPILKMRMSDLMKSGELVSGERGGVKKRSPLVSKMAVSVTSDFDGSRVIVTAPPTIVAEAEALIAELDREGGEESRIMRTIALERSDPGDMVSTINAMLSGERAAPKPKRSKAMGTPGARKSVAGLSAGTPEVTIVAAPGASAIVLSGLRDRVDEVEGWVRHLDESATPDTTLKVFHIRHAEVDQLGDTIMDLCDTGRAKPVRKGKSDPLDFGFEPVSNVRKGTDITLTTDYWNKIILVRATPTKMYEIDQVIRLFDGEEGEEPTIEVAPSMPFLIYELQNVDAFDATIALESLLEVLWTHGELPDVDYISGTNNLVVKCLPEYNSEIEQLIAEYVDKDSDKQKSRAIVYETIAGASAREFAALLKMRMPGVKIATEQLGEDVPTLEELKPYQPCVLPRSLAAVLTGVAAGEVGQVAGDDSEDAKRALAEEMLRNLAAESDPGRADGAGDVSAGDDSAGDDGGAPGDGEAIPSVTIRWDDRQGVLVIEGPPRAVEDVRDELEDIQDEIESSGTKPYIRVFRIKYRKVSVAANILETMFNAAKAPRQQTAVAAQQQRIQQMQQRIQQLQKRRSPAGGNKGQAPTVPVPGQTEDDGGSKKRGTSQIRILGDPQTRSLIIRAAREDFPLIIELLATIDRPPDVTNEFRIFQLKKLVASDVEEQLKVLLGVGASQQRRPSPRRGKQGNAKAQALQQIEDALLTGMTGGNAGAIDASSDIKITSNDKANTLLVMAPDPALELIDDFIVKLEAQEIPEAVRRVIEILHADAEEVVQALEKAFGAGGGRRGGGRGRSGSSGSSAAVTASFTAVARTNSVIVSALEEDFPEIEALIAELDLDMGEEEAVQTYILRNADASDVARTMSDVFGSRGRGSRGGGGGGASPVKFVGDAGSNTLFVTAPSDLREEIAGHIEALDRQAGERAKPKVIVLQDGKASEVARALQDAFSTRGRGSNVKIVGNDLSNQLIVTAPEDLFAEIETLAKTMDQSSLSIAPKTFHLEHAQASEVHKKLMDIVRQLGGQMRNRKSMDVFTAVPDERSNSIVCVGGPVAFGLVEQVIREIDVPESETSTSRIRRLVALKHAESADLARVLNEEIRNSKTGGGSRGAAATAGVTVIANEALNSLLIGGVSADVEEVVAMVEQMDQPAVDKDRMTRVYAVNYADPSSLTQTITNMFRQRRGSKPEDAVDVGYDGGTSKLVVTATEENHEKVAMLLSEVDDASANVRSERIIELKNANADELSRNLQQLFRQTVRGQRGQQGMTIAGDVGTNSLIVYANEAEFGRVQKLIDSLDRKPEESRQRQIKNIKLAHANPWAAKNAITNLFRSRSRNPLDEVTAVEEWGTMSVIVSASPENMAKVEVFLAELDQPSASDNQIHVVELDYADGASVHRALTDLYGRGGRRGQDPRGPEVQISNPQGTNTILVKASAEKFAEIHAVIADLDTASAEPGEIKVIALKYTDAEATKEVLENYLSKPGQAGRRGGTLRGDVRISANAQNNTLIISGSADEVAQLEGVISVLDEEVEGAGNAPRIVTLQYAKPSQIEPTLTQMFAEGSRRGGSRGRGSSSTPVPIIAADDVTNTLIIRASASEFSQMQTLIEQLDTESTASQETFTILAVAPGVQVDELASMVEMTVNEGERIKADRLGIEAGTVVVTPDRRAGALVVAGSASLFPTVERLVRTMETMGPIGGRQVRVLDTKNISAEEVKRLLDQLIDENTGSKDRGSRAKGRSGSRRRSSGSRNQRNQRNRKSPRRGGAKRGR